MKGLMLYDLYKFRALYWKNLLLVSVLYLVMTLALRTTALLYAIVWMSSIYAIGLLSNDGGWTRFARALPVSPKAMAGAKFLTTGFYELAGLLYALALGGIVCALCAEPFGELLLSALSITLFATLFNAIALPCVLKWGAGRMRVIMVLLYALLIVALTSLAGMGDGALTGASAWLNANIGPIMGLFLVVTIAVCVIGWAATAQIYAHREE